MILVDSSIWSLALRRKRRDLSRSESGIAYHARELVIAGDAAVIGLIRQEVLSGIASAAQFEAIKSQLLAVDELAMSTNTYILAAEFFNTCGAAGIAPGAIDMTICAAAHAEAVPIFTVDPDFTRYAKILPIALYKY
jgi:predicted nucleic acid-binding protein